MLSKPSIQVKNFSVAVSPALAARFRELARQRLG